MSSCSKQTPACKPCVNNTMATRGGGRKKDPVWEYFFEGNDANGLPLRHDAVHKFAYCSFCYDKAPENEKTQQKGIYKGRVEMIRHLAESCRHVSPDIKQKIMSSRTTLSSSCSASVADSDANVSKPTGIHWSTVKRGASDTVKQQAKFFAVSQQDCTPNAEETAQIEQLFLRATVSANLPFRWVENPQVVELFAALRPKVLLPSRQRLAGEILMLANNTVTLSHVHTIKTSKYLTLCLDMWKTPRKEYILNYNVVTQSKKVIPAYEVELWTKEKKTGDNLKRHVDKVFQKINSCGKAEIVAVVTDEGPDCRKMKRLIREENPAIVTIPCEGHQTNLWIQDCFKKIQLFKDAQETCVAAIKFINDHQFVLDSIRNQQMQKYGKYLAFAPPGDTRWSSQIYAMETLIRSKDAVRLCIVQESEAILTNVVATSRTKATQFVNDLEKSVFWENLDTTLTCIRPGSIANKILQSDTARLDTMFRVYLELTNHCKELETKPQSTHQAKQMAVLLAKRWSNRDQSLYLLAYVLNPHFKIAGLSVGADHSLTWYKLALLASETYKRLFGESATNMFKEFQQYSNSSGPFAEEVVNEMLPDLHADPSDFYGMIEADFPAISKLALRLFAILVNSACVERDFSSFKELQQGRKCRTSNATVQSRHRLKTAIIEGNNLKKRKHKVGKVLPAVETELPQPARNNVLDEESEDGTDYDSDATITDVSSDEEDEEELMEQLDVALASKYALGDIISDDFLMKVLV